MAEAAFGPAFREISRRGRAEWQTSHFARDGTCTTPFDVPAQDYVLVSMGTSVLAPIPLERRRPALRVYGAFPTHEDARDHADVVHALDAECSLVIVGRGEWVLMPQTTDARDDRAVNAARIRARLDAQHERQVEGDAEFDRVVRERRYVSQHTATEEQADADIEDAERSVYRPPRRLRAGGEVRGQSTCVMCVLRDDGGDDAGECLFKVLGCFENTTEADCWIRNVASREIIHDTIYVAATCEWIFPNGGERAGKCIYRTDELQRIMDAADRNVQDVRTYKEWKKMQEEREAQQQEAKAQEQHSEQEAVELSLIHI